MRFILNFLFIVFMFLIMSGCNEKIVCLDGVQYNKKTSCTQKNAVYCYERDDSNSSCENKPKK